MANIVNVSVGGQTVNSKVKVSGGGQSVNAKTVGGQNINISPGAVTVIGKSPYINEDTGTWMIYNDTTREFEDSGVVADAPIRSVSEEFVIDENGELQIYEVPLEKISGTGSLIQGVSADGTLLPAVNGVVNIPTADDVIAGLVRSSGLENHIAVNPDGTMYVGSLNVNRLTQTAGERFTLNAGSSTD